MSAARGREPEHRHKGYVGVSAAVTGAPILVIGGTGMLGRPVVGALLAAGHPVRVLRRSGAAGFAARVEVYAGDVRDLASLGPALAGVRAVHINLRATWLEDFGPTEAEGVTNVARGGGGGGRARGRADRSSVRLFGEAA